jgi:hypothetical protein
MAIELQPAQTSQQLQWLQPLIGGVLAIIGGFFAVIIRLRAEKKQEISYIKISLIDELTELSLIITRLEDTFTSTHIIPNLYLNNLKANTEAFSFHKPRLFIIKEDKLRRSIVSFYKKLGENIQESINQVGQLGETQSGATHEQIVGKFKTLRTEADTLKGTIEKYKYCTFWIF